MRLLRYLTLFISLFLVAPSYSQEVPLKEKALELIDKKIAKASARAKEAGYDRRNVTAVSVALAIMACLAFQKRPIPVSKYDPSILENTHLQSTSDGKRLMRVRYERDLGVSAFATGGAAFLGFAAKSAHRRVLKARTRAERFTALKKIIESGTGDATPFEAEISKIANDLKVEPEAFKTLFNQA